MSGEDDLLGELEDDDGEELNTKVGWLKEMFDFFEKKDDFQTFSTISFRNWQTVSPPSSSDTLSLKPFSRKGFSAGRLFMLISEDKILVERSYFVPYHRLITFKVSRSCCKNWMKEFFLYYQNSENF